MKLLHSYLKWLDVEFFDDAQSVFFPLDTNHCPCLPYRDFSSVLILQTIAQARASPVDVGILRDYMPFGNAHGVTNAPFTVV